MRLAIAAAVLTLAGRASAQAAPSTTQSALLTLEGTAGQRVVAQMELGDPERLGPGAVCVVPCSLHLAPGRYRVAFIETPGHDARLALPPSGLRLRMVPRDRGRIVAGAVIAGVGYIPVLVGLMHFVVGRSFTLWGPPPSSTATPLDTHMGIAIGVGVGVMLIGLVVLGTGFGQIAPVTAEREEAASRRRPRWLAGPSGAGVAF